MNATRYIAALLFALTLLAGCGAGADKPGATGSTTTPLPPAEASITIVLSGDTEGFIVPCGCTTKQFGGLPRRAAYLSDARKKFGPRLVYLDAGGSILRGTKYDALKFDFISKGMRDMKAAALNIGFGETLLSVSELNNFAGDRPLLSSTVSGPNHSSDRWSRKISVDFASGESGEAPSKWAIIGVNLKENGKEAHDEFTRLIPKSALHVLVPTLTADFAGIILLAYGDEHAALKLAADFPELTAVLIAGCGQSIAPRTENGLVVAGVAQKGKFLARVTLSGHRNNWKLSSGEIVELSESFADDPAQIENLNAYKQKLKELKFDPKDTGEVPSLLKNLPADYRYAGSESCAKCHVQDTALHAKSQHAKGLETLRAKDFAFDPYCLKCHTTGYGGPGGFTNADATPQLGGIGCENCHGPGQAHAANPRIKTPVTNSKSACASCHDSENSPKFEFNAFWEKIKHGQEKVK